MTQSECKTNTELKVNNTPYKLSESLKGYLLYYAERFNIDHSNEKSFFNELSIVYGSLNSKLRPKSTRFKAPGLLYLLCHEKEQKISIEELKTETGDNYSEVKKVFGEYLRSLSGTTSDSNFTKDELTMDQAVNYLSLAFEFIDKKDPEAIKDIEVLLKSAETITATTIQQAFCCNQYQKGAKRIRKNKALDDEEINILLSNILTKTRDEVTYIFDLNKKESIYHMMYEGFKKFKIKWPDYKIIY